MRRRQLQAVIKLGGSAITDKAGGKAVPKMKVLRRLASEIAEAHASTVIVHGGGSYGHPLAKKYRLAEGYKTSEQIIGLAETHRSMVLLNNLVVDELLKTGCPVLPVSPWSCFFTDNGRIVSSDLEPIVAAVALGCTPVLHGDVVFDRKRHFTILSGDQIAGYLAHQFKARRLIFALDVGGIYTTDPYRKGARLIKKLRLDQLKRLAGKASRRAKGEDVTGGIRRKLLESIPAVQAGVTVCFASVREEGNVRSAIKGNSFRGTIVEGIKT